MDFSISGIFGQFCGANQARYLKTVFCPFKGSHNKVFPVKNMAFKIFIFSLFKICNFCQIFKKSCFIILLMSGLCHFNGT